MNLEENDDTVKVMKLAAGANEIAIAQIKRLKSRGVADEEIFKDMYVELEESPVERHQLIAIIAVALLRAADDTKTLGA